MADELDDKVIEEAVTQVKLKSEALQGSVDDLVQLLERRTKRKEKKNAG